MLSYTPQLVAAPGCFLRAREVRLLCPGPEDQELGGAPGPAGPWQAPCNIPWSPGVLNKARLSLAKISSFPDMERVASYWAVMERGCLSVGLGVALRSRMPTRSANQLSLGAKALSLCTGALYGLRVEASRRLRCICRGSAPHPQVYSGIAIFPSTHTPRPLGSP